MKIKSVWIPAFAGMTKMSSGMTKMSLGMSLGMRMVSVLTLVMLSISLPHTSFAGIDELVKYATPDGSMSNLTKGAIVKDQQGGYMTGGSILIRGPRPKTLQPLLVQTPKFAFDACTGSADFRFGGLSYVSSAEMTKFFKAMAKASGSYAVKMLIKTACPQCENIMSDLEAIARDINGLMLDQCSAGQAIAQGAFARLGAGNTQKCMMQSNAAGQSKDMYETSEKCKSNPDRYGASGEEDELISLLGNEFNLVWKSIGKGGGQDRGFKELIMSVSGTIIGKKVDGRYQFTNKPSLVLKEQLLEKYIGIDQSSGEGGSKLKLYSCDDENKCLKPEEREISLSQNETLYGNVRRIIKSLETKIAEGASQGHQGMGQGLTDEEAGLVAFSSIPLINLIENELISKARTEDLTVRLPEVIEVICYDVITNFLDMMVSQAQGAVKTLEYAQLDSVVIRDFESDASQVKAYLREAKHGAFQRLQITMQVKERLEQQEKVFEYGFNRFMTQNSR
jgi:conjugative transfer pilus assembly protein TraH